jgi:hypothetical protein
VNCLLDEPLHRRQVIEQPPGKAGSMLILKLDPNGSGLMIICNLQMSQSALQKTIETIHLHIPFSTIAGQNLIKIF